jgi:hypothetical protein
MLASRRDGSRTLLRQTFVATFGSYAPRA